MPRTHRCTARLSCGLGAHLTLLHPASAAQRRAGTQTLLPPGDYPASARQRTSHCSSGRARCVARSLTRSASPEARASMRARPLGVDNVNRFAANDTRNLAQAPAGARGVATAGSRLAALRPPRPARRAATGERLAVLVLQLVDHCTCSACRSPPIVASWGVA